MGNGWQYGPMDDGGISNGVWGFIMMGMFFLFVALAIIAISRMRHQRGYLNHGSYNAHHQFEVSGQAVEMLQTRFASGEISNDEYTKALDLLKGKK